MPDAQHSSIPEIIISTAVENYSPRTLGAMTLRAVVMANGFPSTMFQAFVLREGDYVPVPMDTHVNDLRNCEKIVLQCNRNPDLLQLDPPVREPMPAHDHVVSIRVPGESLDKARFEPLTIRFTEQEARDAVSDAVFDELSTHCASGTLLTGLSGGGDSNAMAPGIQRWQQNSPRTRKVVVFTLEFEAIWPSAGTSRARQLCAKYGFTHLVIGAAAMTQLLDLRTSVGEFYFD
jgi:hypothetical protein